MEQLQVPSKFALELLIFSYFNHTNLSSFILLPFKYLTNIKGPSQLNANDCFLHGFFIFTKVTPYLNPKNIFLPFLKAYACLYVTWVW
jgi:hypothetical protein